MYGYYTRSQDGGLDFDFITFCSEPCQDLTPQRQSWRKEQAAARLAPELVATTLKALPYVAEDADAIHVICMSAEFFKSHGNDAPGILSEIDGEIDREFGALPAQQGNAKVAHTVARMRSVGFLLPVAARRFCFKNESRRCRYEVLTSLRGKEPVPAEIAPWRTALHDIAAAIPIKGGSTVQVTLEVMARAIVSCERAMLDPMVEQIKQVLKTCYFASLHPLLLSTIRNKVGAMPDCHVDDMVRASIENAAAQSATSANGLVDGITIITEALSRAREDLERMHLEIMRATDAAIDAGVDFGPRTEFNKQALAIRRQRQDAADREMLLTVLSRIEHPAGPAQQDAAISRICQSMTTLQLARWINGRPFGRHHKPLNAAKVVQEHDAQVRARKAARARPDPQLDPGPDSLIDDPDLTPETVHQVGIAALRDSAEFFRAELTDLIALAKRLDADAKLAQAAARMNQQLDGLIRSIDKTPGELHLDGAQDLLGDAEDELVALRAGIAVAQADARLRARFDAELRQLLSLESLWEGRSDGGQIACRLKASDWGWVNRDYHGGMLSQRGLKRGNQRTPLRDDQALALYVTLGSNSGYLFDVSVHLWQRIGGSSEPPCLPQQRGQRTFAPMNREHWYDTYTSCLVAHAGEG